MNIALDATPLMDPSGGIRRYTEELARALAENFPADDFWLLSDQSFDLPAGALSNLQVGRRPQTPLERRWWLWGLPQEISRLQIDVFHGTDFAVPYLSRGPSVMTLHDLSPWMNPDWHPESNRVRKRTPWLLRLGLVTMVITPSEAVRKQAMERFDLEANRVVAVPLAAAGIFRPRVSKPAGTPYLLYVGTIEPRKNLALLLDVWREVRRDRAVDLVIAGRRREDAPRIADEPGLRILGLTREEQLPELYCGALALVYPSHYEGFGLPVLEAMQCGAAVIASCDPAIREVTGGAAILLDANDRRAWAETLRTLVEQPERLRDLRQRALARAAEFSWSKTAILTREVYEQAVQRFRNKS
jgi:glycosyltransferase involved in cell wall biosynthesis